MRTYVVHGPPLSGKSTYVQQHRGSNDLVFDFDLVMAALTGKPAHEHNEHLVSYVVDIRDLIIARLKSEENLDTAWIITTRVTDQLKQSLVGLNAEYIEIKADIHTVKERLRQDPDGRDIDEWTQAINRYYAATEDYSSFYKSKRWERKRLAVLKRDQYLCQNAARFGKTEAANTVHHVIPIAERPDLKLDDRNLISLSEDAHGRMHLKHGSGLSKLGEEWRERILRRHPELAQPAKIV